MKSKIFKNIKSFCTLIFFLAIGVLHSQDKAKTMIQLEITGIKNSAGFIQVAVYNSDTEFDKEVFIKVIAVPASSEVHVSIPNLDIGKYAIAVYHDENKNQKLDKNFVGIPKEGYGFSNNAVGKLGPPKFSETSFSLDTQLKKLSIRMNY
ncbi:MAG: DUF2141 domain-containing protein [Spirochaetia bacterium]|nr:DUF2141 domain-containing protein [Spirochaetia bacterium]